jgi:hypothetical protein
MLAEIAMVRDRIKCWGVKFGERWMGVLAMKTFLKTINPNDVSTMSLKSFVDSHSFPIESSFV